MATGARVGWLLFTTFGLNVSELIKCWNPQNVSFLYFEVAM